MESIEDFELETGQPVSPVAYVVPGYQSASIAALATALAAAQAEIKNPEKNSENPHFRNTYADLTAVLDAIRSVFPKHGLAFTQTLQPTGLVTQVTHKSGEWIRSVVPVRPEKDTPQGFGSALTYMRRYTAQSIAGIAAETDDDAEGAMKRNSAPTGAPRRKVKR